MTLNGFHKAMSLLSDTSPIPVLFVGHGSPMNALENNEFTKTWEDVSKSLPFPRAIVCISAHWETRGIYVTADLKPKTIHDFYGFPPELYKQEYPASGSPELAKEIIDNVENTKIENSLEWGLDHGTWSVLKYFYPHADIPVIQISIDHFKDAQWHYALGMTRKEERIKIFNDKVIAGSLSMTSFIIGE